MKRLLALMLLTAICTALLCGCGGDKADPSPTVAVPVTEAPTAAPTVAVTEAAAQEPTQPLDMVDPSWFNDAVFVGDSISTTLDMFSADEPELFVGDAKFVCADSLSYHNAQWDLYDENAVHPTYQGQIVLAETAAQITGANKLFVLMGINDLGTYGVEDTMNSLKEWIQKVLACSPNVEIYLQSTTPMITPCESDWLNNGMIVEFDRQLQAYCSENGFHYLDVYHAMCDETGALRAEWCDDPNDEGIHFNYKGCIAWANYLRSAVKGVGAAAGETTAATTAADTGDYEDEEEYAEDDDYVVYD